MKKNATACFHVTQAPSTSRSSLTPIELVETDVAMPLNQKQVFLQSKIELLPAIKDPTGLRVDLSIEDPVTGEHKLIDVTVAHTTAASYLSKELNAVKQRQVSATFANNHKLPNPLHNDPSPTLA